jgi:serine/threonine-protein kinase
LVCTVDGEALTEEPEGERTPTPPSLPPPVRRTESVPPRDSLSRLPTQPVRPPSSPTSQPSPPSQTDPTPPTVQALGSEPSDPQLRQANAPYRRPQPPRSPTQPLQTTAPSRGSNPRIDGTSPAWQGERLGPYRLLRQLGEGGMARIYLAEHEKLGRICAIKRLHADHFADRITVARFLAEARAVGAIHHPNLVAAYDVVEEPHEIYLVMEYLDGQDVAQLLREGGPMEPARAAEIVAQACDGLAAVHAHNIVHRDLKPENIFLARDGDGVERVKLLDFGVARLMGDRPQELKTRSGLTVGTPTYMSPEQATASEIDARSDVYTVGVVLFEMLAGAPPFTGAGYGDVMLMHVNDPAPRLSSRRPDVAPWLDQLVARCLEKKPGQRFQSATELGAALRAGPSAQVAPTGAEAPSPPAQAIEVPRPRMDRFWTWAALVGGIAVVGGAALFAAEPWHGTPQTTTMPPAAEIAPLLPVSTAARPAPVEPVVTPLAAPTVAPAVARPVAAAPQRKVHVVTVPSHAMVALAGSAPCRAPCDVPIPAGSTSTLDIRASAPRYLAESRLIEGASPPSSLRIVLHHAPRGHRHGPGHSRRHSHHHAAPR